MFIKSLAAALLGGALCASLPSQVTWVGSVGAQRPIPDTSGVFNGGLATLCGYYCPNQAQPLFFEFTGVDTSWNSPPPVTTEQIYFILDTPFSVLPGCPIGGGFLYGPNCAAAPAVTIGPFSSSFIGPFPLCIGGSGLCGPIPSPNRSGAVYRTTIPAGTVGNFSMQAVMIDPVSGQFYTSNAIDFSIP